MRNDDVIEYYVARDAREQVTHLVRTIRSATALRAEYFRDGAWHADPSAFTVADDGSFSKPIDEAEAFRIIDEQRAAAPARDPHAALRTGFGKYFLGRGPELPATIPAKGGVTGGGWTVRFVLRDTGDGAALEFLAERSTAPPIRGRIHADGSAVTLESYVDTYYVDPSLGETDEDGRRRMREHNDRVTAELRAVGLL